MISPNGKPIAVGGANQIRLIPMLGSRSRMTIPIKGTVSALRWSPSGASIRFLVNYPASLENAFWELTPSTGNVRRILRTKGYTYGLMWSPKDGHFFYDQGVDDRTNIWLLKRQWMTGREVPIQLTSGPIAWRWPTAGPDVNRIFALGEKIK